MAPLPHPNFSVAIIGAGLGGLQLARVLQQGGVHTTVYERETSPVSRNQGGTLDIHLESGQQALKIAGLLEELGKIVHPEADTMKIVDQRGRVTFDDQEMEFGPPGGDGPEDEVRQMGEKGERGERGEQSRSENGRPEVDRGELRQILLNSLLPNTIKWGHNLSSCKLMGDTKVEVQFSEPPQTAPATFDMVIGADGTWSRVRPLLSSAKPDYTGVTFIDIQLTDVDSTLPEISTLVGKGTLSALGNNQALIAQRNIGDKVRVYVALRVPFTWPETTGIASLVAQQQFSRVQELLLSEFNDWSDELRAIISSADLENSTFAVRPLMMLPSEHSWRTVGRVTLLGDAAHVMSPFAGEGANLAMLDGAELGQAIVGWRNGDGGTLLVDVVGEFEKKMLARSKEKSEESISNQELFISENGAVKAGDRIRELMSAGPPPPYCQCM